MSARGGAPRHQSRRAALQVLYAADVSGARAEQAAAPIAEVFEGVAAHFDLHGRAHAFAKELVLGVETHRAQIDAQIAAHARNWRLERMAAVDRNVLRLAGYGCCTPPRRHACDRRSGGAGARVRQRPSPAFINGVLDAIARDLGDAGDAT